MIGRITPRKLNADSDDRSLTADEMKMAVNISVDSDTGGDGGVVKLADGNTSVLPSDPLSGIEEGVNTVIGSVSDEELSVVYFFVHNSLNNHGIYAYSSVTNTYRKIFSSSTLDFDENGFVKGDVVRIKRQYDLEPAEFVLGQGGSGGVDTDTGGGGGPSEPVGELNPLAITYQIGRDMYPLLELSDETYRQGGFGQYSLASIVDQFDFQMKVTGTYTEAGTGARREPVPIDFYESSDLDLNIPQESLQEVIIPLSAENTPDGRSAYIRRAGQVYVDPNITIGGTYELTFEISAQVPVQTIGGSSNWTSDDEGYELNTFSEVIVASGNPESVSDFSSDNNFQPTIRIPSKNRDQLTVGDLYGDTFFTLEQIDGPNLGGNGVLFGQKFLNSKTVNPEDRTSLVERTDEEISDLKLWERTVPVSFRIDHSTDPDYADFVELWLEQQNANDDSGEYDVQPPDVLRGGVRRTDDEGVVEVFYYQFCAASMNYNILGTGPSISRQDGQGNYRPWNELISVALQNYSDFGYTADDQYADSYLSYSAVQSAFTQVVGSQFEINNNYTLANWIMVAVPSGEGCAIPDVVDLFSPSVIVAPVDPDRLSPVDQLIVPPSYVGSTAWSEASVQDMVDSNGRFMYTVDLPVSFLGEASGNHHDFLIFQYNDSPFARYRGIEDVDPSSISASVRIASTFSGYPYLELNTGWNASENLNSLWAESDLTLSYPLSSIGQPNELTGQGAKGRRIRISATNGREGMQDMNAVAATYLSPESIFYQGVNKDFNGLAFGDTDQFSSAFCYRAYTSCDSNRLSPSVRATYTAPPPVINEGDVTGRDEDPRTDSPTTTAPEKDAPVRDSGLSLAPKTPSAGSEKTKKTIKKKY